MEDYDDPEIEAQWLAEQRIVVAEYLQSEGISHGRIAKEPAWHLAPYVALWAVEPMGKSGSTGWWAISGDLPNDYVSVDRARSPREAVHAIATLWTEAAEYMARGERHPSFMIGDGENDAELAPLLASRAKLLLEWVDEPDIWEVD